MGEDSEVRCKHFVLRKKRYCKMTVKIGEEYCGEHQPQIKLDQHTTENDSRKRIVCPYDSKHTCYANKLKAHLKKCNAKPTALPAYIQKDINVGNREIINTKERLLANTPVSQILEVIAKINKVHSDVIAGSLAEKHLSHPVLSDELNNPEYGNSTKKHLMQSSAIIGLLNEFHLLQPDTCYIEFGAGKGKLSYWVAKTLENSDLSTSSVLLIERSSHRHKCDNKLDKSTGQIVRIRADIADLVLSKIETVNKSKQIVGLTKHLCGDATDLALRCLTNCQKTDKVISGVIMAFCCHHRCQWSSYVGKTFFEDVGLTQSDFDVMCGLVSWAVCGTGQSRERRQNPEVIPEQNKRDIEIGLNRNQKEEIGKKSKDILNWGRKMYLQSYNFKSDLYYYVAREVSLENVCLVGLHK